MICDCCGEFAAYTCSACRNVTYCSKKCQTIDWIVVHEIECPLIYYVEEESGETADRENSDIMIDTDCNFLKNLQNKIDLFTTSSGEIDITLIICEAFIQHEVQDPHKFDEIYTYLIARKRRKRKKRRGRKKKKKKKKILEKRPDGRRRKKYKVSPTKARQILREGTVRGHPLTKRQRRFFGWLAGGGGDNNGNINRK